MKRWYFLLLIAVVPAVVFVHTWQVFQYRQLENEIEKLQEEEKELVEQNKRLIAGIAVLRSPRRLEKIAREELGLTKLEAGRLIRVLLAAKERSRQASAEDLND